MTLDDILQVDHGARHGAAKLVVLITDGASDNSALTVKTAFDLKTSGVSVAAVAIGQNLDQVPICISSLTALNIVE